MRVGGCADTQGNNHESYLRYRTECKHSLYVALHAGHHCRIKGGEGSHIRRDMQDSRGIADEQREHPCHKVDTRNNHCRRMDEGRHRGRALHGVRQPDVKREHCALAGSSDEHQSECKRKQGFGCPQGRCIRSEGECPGVESVDQDADKEAEVSEAGDDECLLGCSHGFFLCIVESDEEV